MALLSQSLQAGSLFLHNRLVMPPMYSATANEDGTMAQKVLDYYDEKSKGGYISLIIVEHTYISPEGRFSKNQLAVDKDDTIDNLKILSDLIKRNGSKAAIQLAHAGSTADKEICGFYPVGPSEIQNPRMGKDIPRELTKNGIADLIHRYKDAALRVKRAGFDALEIHSAHGYLLHQFYSPLSNNRTDEYGGSILNRIRIHLEIVEEMRPVLGKGYPIILRFGAADLMEGGATIYDSLIAVKEFEKAGVDILDISGGFCGYIFPGQGYFAPFTEAIKREVAIPVILTGGITEAKFAEKMLSEGKADLIGVGRAIVKDSTWAENSIKSLA